MKHSQAFKPDALVSWIIWVNAAVFAISLLYTGSSLSFTINPFAALSPSTDVLLFLGATGQIPIDHSHAWWSLFTANWLHGSLLHILFNMMALKTVAPLVIKAFGSARTFSIYTLAGVGGFFASYLGHVPLTVGASAGLCGLIGALLFYGKSRGGHWGQLVVRQTSGWIVSLLLVGIVVPRVNNWGHGGGFIAGMALGWILGYLEARNESMADKVLALALAAITFVLLARVVVAGGMLIFF
jgi:rhomboid protease GluP